MSVTLAWQPLTLQTGVVFATWTATACTTARAGSFGTI
jgi:hypothetical protein